MNKHLKPVFKSLMDDNKRYSAVLQSQGFHAAMSYVQNVHLNATIGPVVQALYRDAAKMAYPKTKIQKSVIPMFGFVRDVIQYFRDHLLKNVVLPISNTTRNRVERELRTSIQEGRGVEETVRAINDPALERRRAKTIVRTESVRAMNYSQMTAADNEKYQVNKTWIAVEDLRTRVAHSHAGVDGEIRQLEDPFSNGLMFPGDPDADAAETINCRCTLGYELARDQQGRPLKKNRSVLV